MLGDQDFLKGVQEEKVTQDLIEIYDLLKRQCKDVRVCTLIPALDTVQSNKIWHTNTLLRDAFAKKKCADDLVEIHWNFGRPEMFDRKGLQLSETGFKALRDNLEIIIRDVVVRLGPFWKPDIKYDELSEDFSA